MRKVLSILLGILIFVSVCPNVYAAEKGQYGRPYFYEDDEEIPIDVIIEANLIGETYNICPEFLEAIAWHESRYTADATNGTCKGLMQINVASHKARMLKLNVTDIYDVHSNILVAADYLAELFETYEDPAIVLAIYHGEKNYSETHMSKYVKEILEHSAELERQHGR